MAATKLFDLRQDVTQNQYPRLVGDIDGNGKADIVGFGLFSDRAIHSMLNPVESGVLGIREAFVDNLTPAPHGWTSQDVYPRLLGDVNNDGLDDIVGFGNHDVWTSLSNGDGTFAEPFIALNERNFTLLSYGWYSNNLYPRFLGNVDNRNGLDIVAFGDKHVWIALANGDGTFATPKIGYSNGFTEQSGSWQSQTLLTRRLIGDIDGKNGVDLVGIRQNEIHLSLGNGDGSFAPAFIQALPPGGVSSYNFDRNPIDLADINNDGRDDLVVFNDDAVKVAYSTVDPSGAFHSFGGWMDLVTDEFTFNDNGWTSFDKYPRFFADITGDDRLDIIGFGINSTPYYQSLVAPGSPPVRPSPPQPPRPPIQNGEIRLHVQDPELSVVWGQTATLEVEVEAPSNYVGSVQLSVPRLPYGVTAQSRTVEFTSSGPSRKIVQLQLSTAEAGSSPGSSELCITAESSLPGVRNAREGFSLVVNREQGRFDEALGGGNHLRWNFPSPFGGQTVGPIEVRTTAGQTNNHTISFYKNGAYLGGGRFSGFYKLSDDGRTAFVQNAAAGVNNLTWSVYNLDIDPALAGVRRGGIMLSGQRGAPSNIYFSEDGTLLVTVTASGGIGTVQAANATLFDLLRPGGHARSLGSFTGTATAPRLEGNTISFTPRNASGHDLRTGELSIDTRSQNLSCGGSARLGFNGFNPLPSPQEASQIAEYGLLALNHTWQTVTLSGSYTNPVVIAGDPSRNGGDPAAVRIRNVGSNSFQIRLQEPIHNDGTHVNETVSWLVIEAGEYELSDGTRLSAGTTDTNLLSPQGFETVGFTTPFADGPTVLSQIQTFNGPDWAITRTDAITGSSFDLTMQEEERLNRGRHATETIGWLAIDPTDPNGTANDGDTFLQAATSTDSITNNPSGVSFAQPFSAPPVLIAKLSSFDGPDPANLRIMNLTSGGFSAIAAEDRSFDAELHHTTEQAGWLALAGPAGTIEAFAV